MSDCDKPKLRFSKFEASWEKFKLSELGEFKNGINKSAEDFGHGYPFLNLMDVFGRNSIANPTLELVNSTEKERQVYSIQKGDTFFIRSSVKRAGIGETAVCESDIVNTVYSGFLIRFRSNELIDHSYKRFCFWTPEFRNSLIRLSTTSANTNINQESLSKLKVQLPSLEEQRKIAEFLSSVDKKISLLKEKYALFNQYKKGVMQKIFKQEVRFKDDNGGNFPDWKTERVDYFVERFSNPVDVDKNETYREIGVRSHGKGVFHKEAVSGEELGGKRVFWVHPDAFVVNIVFAWEHAVAKTSDTEQGFIASHRFPMYLPKSNRVDLRFFTLFFKSKRGKYLLELASPGGAGRNKTLGQSNFAELKVTFPVLEEQKRIADFVDLLEQKLEALNQQIELTQTFKKGLLQQMFV